MSLALVVSPAEDQLVRLRAQPLRISMTSIVPKRLSCGRVVQQDRLAVRPHDMAALRILYVDLVHECGERHNEPRIVIFGPKDVATGVLSAAYRFGYGFG